MRATYCPQCDETRWQLTGLPVQRASTCSMCGTALETERRLPGRTRSDADRAASLERRGAEAAPASPV
jgi:hypothetical protein